MAGVLGKDYIDLKIDQDRHTHGKAVAERLRKERRGGIPWMVILGADGTELITSDGPEGNCGCPVAPAERAWFVEMLRRTGQHLDEDDLGVVEAELAAFAQELGR